MSHNLPSLLEQWFFGSSGPDVKARPLAKTVGLFVLFLVPVFLLSWVIFIAYRPIHLGLLSLLAELAFLFDSARVRFAVEGSQIVFDCLTRPRFEAHLSGSEITANTPLLWSLLVASPGIALGRRGAVLLKSTAILLLSQSLFLVIKVQVALLAADHPAAGSALIWSALDDLFEITGKGFVPIALWIYFALPYFLGRVDPRKRLGKEAARRNDPCPCGSGKKYKKCCR